jgi:hypothetical protein
MAPRAMPSDAVVALRVMGGDPMPTGGAMVNTRRHFCHRRWWRHRRDIGRWWRARRRRWRRRGNAGRQAEHRQCDQDGHNRGFHIADPFIFRRANGVRWSNAARGSFTPRLSQCRGLDSPRLPKNAPMRHVRHIQGRINNPEPFHQAGNVAVSFSVPACPRAARS